LKRRPFGGGLRGRNGRIHHGSTRKRRSSGPREAHMPELKPLLNIQKCTFHSHFETQTTSPPVEQAKNLSFTPKMMESRPRLNNPLFLNLRTNSFQLGRMMENYHGVIHRASTKPRRVPREILKIQNMDMDSQYHRLTVVTTTSRGESHVLSQFCFFNFLTF